MKANKAPKKLEMSVNSQLSW